MVLYNNTSISECRARKLRRTLCPCAPYRFLSQQAGQKLVAVLDKKIYEALMYADEVVDTKKDETIEGMVSAKKTISSLGPVETAVVRRRVHGPRLFPVKGCTCFVDSVVRLVALQRGSRSVRYGVALRGGVLLLYRSTLSYCA